MKAKGYGFFSETPIAQAKRSGISKSNYPANAGLQRTIALNIIIWVEKSDHSSSEYFFGYVQEKYAGQGIRKNPLFALNVPIFQKMKI